MPYTGAESVEMLVQKSGEEEERTSATCDVFSCFSAKESVRETKDNLAHKRASRRIGIEKEMRVTYQQPHLVEPMKLTVYDEIPTTPMLPPQPSQMARFVSHSRKSISRASTRASMAARKRTPKSSISKVQNGDLQPPCQLRRNPSFRPLQLSIYMADKRLSDLPEFDTASFTDEGEIKLPPRALVRTQSEDMLRRRDPIQSEPVLAKPASMFEQSFTRRMSHVRQNTDSTIVSSSRPPSEYDALHSHPVSWYSMPGIPPTMQFATAPALSKTILSPMQEEFTPPPSGAVIIDGKVLAFPDIDAGRTTTETAHLSLLATVSGEDVPSPSLGPNRRTTIITKHQAKISQSASILLASSNNSIRTQAATLERQINVHKPRESSISTIKTSSTTSSFAEHRRKRSNFYLLNQPDNSATEPERPSTAPATSPSKAHKTPTPLKLYQIFPPQKSNKALASEPKPASVKSYTHVRNQTASTVASTVATDVLFEVPELVADVPEYAESVTTVDMKSRTGTMKSTMTVASSHDLEKEGFRFRNTPSPALESPDTPLSVKTQDVEKMMYEMCAQSGYRRVNVGVAF